MAADLRPPTSFRASACNLDAVPTAGALRSRSLIYPYLKLIKRLLIAKLVGAVCYVFAACSHGCSLFSRPGVDLHHLTQRKKVAGTR